ncbi:MAG: hypothetical protein ACLQAN_06090 [Acidimicrobiales bacterium]
MIKASPVLFERQLDRAITGTPHRRHLSRQQNGAAAEIDPVGANTSDLLSPLQQLILVTQAIPVVTLG